MATESITGLEELLGRLGLATPFPALSFAQALSRPMGIYRAFIADTAARILGCDIAVPWDAVQSSASKVDGDFALTLPKLRLGDDQRQDLTLHSVNQFKSPLFELPWVDAVHLRFVIALETVPQLILPYVHDRLDRYGTLHSPSGEPAEDAPRKKVVVEFSSPNLASEFTAAHVRSTIVGSQLATLYEKMGWDVTRLNYLGDWGKDVGLLVAGWKRFGSEEAFKRDPMTHLLEVHDKIHELFEPEKEAWMKARAEGGDTSAIEAQGIHAERDDVFKQMQDRDAEALALWKFVHDASVDYYTEAYARLNITFDEISGESQVSQDAIDEVERVLKEKGVYEESEGSWIIDYTKHGPKPLGAFALRGRTGNTTYLLRDIAAVIDRDKKFAYDRMLYVVKSELEIHFQKVFQALRYMGRDDLVDKLDYVSFGKVSGMLPQFGRVQHLNDIINESTSAMRDVLSSDKYHGEFENNDATADLLGVTALIAQDAMHRRATGYNFNTQSMVSFGSNAGLQLQIGYSKLCAKINESDADDVVLENIDYSHLQEEPWTDVLLLMAQYPDVVAAALKQHEPSLILTHLVKLDRELVNNCLTEDDEDDGAGGGPSGSSSEPPDPPEAVLAQAVLYKHARQVLENGMSLLGLPATSVPS
ncbi:arginyl-tRNA synthetase [Xylariaceae sp. FL0016]|nr:arginyl-tRNA synthetase [Xylariaceae sp. FL0016]